PSGHHPGDAARGADPRRPRVLRRAQARGARSPDAYRPVRHSGRSARARRVLPRAVNGGHGDCATGAKLILQRRTCLYRFVFPALLIMALAAPAAMSQEGQLDASPGIFTVMAAINAVGYAADLSSPSNHPLRDAIRAELAKRNIPSLPAIKAIFDQHRKPKDTDELSQYISLALTLGGPPDFGVKLRNVDMPPDATPLLGLAPLLAAFYKEANIKDLW